jgi:hypothetical protein
MAGVKVDLSPAGELNFDALAQFDVQICIVRGICSYKSIDHCVDWSEADCF